MKKLAVAVAAMAMTSVAMSATVKVGIDNLGESLDESTLVGFHRALFGAIAQRTGDTYEFVKVPASNEKIQKLVAGEVDVLPGVIKREHRKNKQLIFSTAYRSAEMSTLLKKSEAKNTRQLKNKLVCVCSEAEKKIAESYSAKPLVIAHWKDKFTYLEQGKCVAVVASRSLNDTFMKTNPENKKLYVHKHKWFNFFNNFSIASTKDKKEIITKISAAIKVLKQNGTLKEMLKKYFADSAK